MILNTHLLFSRLIFSRCLKRSGIKICKSTFMYGNIRPDIFPEKPKDSHTLEDNEGIVRDYINKLTNTTLSTREFSLVMGMLCHYICDFFCIYHRKEYKDKSMREHLIYETKLHFQLINLLITRKLKFLKLVNSYPQDTLSIVFEMREAYQKENESIKKDITFAISTAILMSEALLSFRTIEAVSKKNRLYELQKVAGII